MLYGFMVGGGGVTLLLWEVLIALLVLMMFVFVFMFSCEIIFCGCIWTCG